MDEWRENSIARKGDRSASQNKLKLGQDDQIPKGQDSLSTLCIQASNIRVGQWTIGGVQFSSAILTKDLQTWLWQAVTLKLWLTEVEKAAAVWLESSAYSALRSCLTACRSHPHRRLLAMRLTNCRLPVASTSLNLTIK